MRLTSARLIYALARPTPSNGGKNVDLMVCINQELESPTGESWPSPVLKKPQTATSTRTQKPLQPEDEEEKCSVPSTGSSSLALDSFDISLGTDDTDQALHDMAGNLIGRNVPFQSPFGVKAQVYADYTASGKSLECIERFIHDHVMPTYGNTHTTTSVTGLQTTAFREEARQIIAKAVNARESKDVVIFAGQGCTSAINKLVTALGINKGRRRHRASKRPVVFTCPFSHHSNLLPWLSSSSYVTTYFKYTPPPADMLSGTTSMINYLADANNHGFHSVDTTWKTGGEFQDLIMWEQLTDEARGALNDTDFGEHAPVPFIDPNFKANLEKAWPH
uniref:Uncharacterized protein n=1 Tax=Phytophthora ramorum TaxID=164328 RepID=H3H413_PHYRM